MSPCYATKPITRPVPSCVLAIDLTVNPPLATVCGWCQPEDKPGDKWVEHEGFRVTHGICRDCKDLLESMPEQRLTPGEIDALECLEMAKRANPLETPHEL